MKKELIKDRGICGLNIELSTFNMYKLIELKDELEAVKHDRERYAEISKIGYDKRTDEQKEEFAKLNRTVKDDLLNKLCALLNNFTSDFKSEEDDLFAEEKPQHAIGTRENPRMFEDTTFG